MPSDYDFIRRDSVRRYGEDIGHLGHMLLANRYADRTHFIFELLQNAEDALRRRGILQGSREITFALGERQLQVRHHGAPFTAADVKSICRIGRSSKEDFTEIGHFGIGFKSVYAFTDRPEIHSGDEDFVIENFVWPGAAKPVQRSGNETVIILPLKDDQGADEIQRGLQELGPRALMFLREIEEITWSIEGGPDGLYMRTKPKWLDNDVRQISLLGQTGAIETDEDWLVLSREVRRLDHVVGHVEVAFKIEVGEHGDAKIISPIAESPLVVFFPTVLPTHLGFLVQGPFRTTPSRDNVPATDSWNRYLIKETAALLVEALPWLRDHGLLDEQALLCLPLNPAKFGADGMFAPLFTVTRNALKAEPLLPDFEGSHVSASDAKLGRTSEIREFFGSRELTELYSEGGRVTWVSGRITQDRTPELRQYLLRELDVTELTPTSLLPKLARDFLERRTDRWVRQLYEYLSGQPALLRQGWLRALPLVRLENGPHVAAKLNGEPQAFLPGPTETGFPTVRDTVCNTEEARKFLESLGLTKPDPVDDVILNILPRFTGDGIAPATYVQAMDRILRAFKTDSQAQRDKLVASLKNVPFVAAVDAHTGPEFMKPGDVYLATERLKGLFANVRGVALVDHTYESLHGDTARRLLQECGTVGYLRPCRKDHALTSSEMADLRKKAGHEETSGLTDRVKDRTLRGLTEILKLLPRLDPEERRARARLLWEELAHLEDRRGKALFEGSYTWTHNRRRYQAPFPAAFLRTLGGTSWIPNGAGELRRPELVLFDTLGWAPNAFLLSKIRFKSPIVAELARQAGIEPGVIDLLKELNLGSEGELRKRLGIPDDAGSTEDPAGGSGGDPEKPKAPNGGNGGGTENGGGGGSGTAPDQEERAPATAGGSGRDRVGEFISYVTVHPDDSERKPDGLEHKDRMALETQAINLVCRSEPGLKRARTGNPGYDLFEVGPDGRLVRWIEVKAMAKGLVDRPVGLSRAQFKCAREHADAYWIYVVEYAGHPHGARVVRIQDPAGKARTFTFDSGWLDIAQIDDRDGD